ncbi:hypothetical protein E2542_SST16841 [Spatholobus suberectus]|nr:hypothetical protein E2542_SST16841 [Spatholobus suberectus]
MFWPNPTKPEPVSTLTSCQGLNSSGKVRNEEGTQRREGAGAGAGAYVGNTKEEVLGCWELEASEHRTQESTILRILFRT